MFANGLYTLVGKTLLKLSLCISIVVFSKVMGQFLIRDQLADLDIDVEAVEK